jgi:hypothetical protein
VGECSCLRIQTRAHPSMPKPRSRPLVRARRSSLFLCYFHVIRARRRGAGASQSANLHIEGSKVTCIGNFPYIVGWTTALQIPYNVVYTTLTTSIQRTTTDHVVSAIDVEAPDPRNAIVRYIKR